MKVSTSLRNDLLEAIPRLRAFAIALCRDRDKADDLVQEALIKAWANLDKFEEGTDLRAWLFRILRNEFYSGWRKRRLEVEDPHDMFALTLRDIPTQDGHMDLRDCQTALGQLPGHQREAVLLVGPMGMSYDEAAQICQCAPGTIKSRVNRARSQLAELLGLERGEGYPVNPRQVPIEKVEA